MTRDLSVIRTPLYGRGGGGPVECTHTARERGNGPFRLLQSASVIRELVETASRFRPLRYCEAEYKTEVPIPS